MTFNPSFKPFLRGHSHQAMFFVSIGALGLLLSLTNTNLELFSILVYSFGVLCMFGVSTLYHRVKWSDENLARVKRLDHSAIYLMIAGTFTPVGMLGLSTSSMQVLLGTIWGITALGIVKSIWLTNLPRILNAVFYLIAGYMIAPYIGELTNNIGLTNIVLILGGGVIYSVGAVIYAIEKPNPFPLFFGYHEVFHLMVNAAAIIHFIVVYSLLTK